MLNKDYLIHLQYVCKLLEKLESKLWKIWCNFMLLF